MSLTGSLHVGTAFMIICKHTGLCRVASSMEKITKMMPLCTRKHALGDKSYIHELNIDDKNAFLHLSVITMSH